MQLLAKDSHSPRFYILGGGLVEVDCQATCGGLNGWNNRDEIPEQALGLSLDEATLIIH